MSARPTFDTIVVLDFEATCLPTPGMRPQEVIELPSALVSLEEGKVIDDFTTFVRPVHHPRLTSFCTRLTGIRQQDVEGAPLFPAAFEAHAAWLRRHGLHERPFAFLTCGDWDLKTMMPVQCAASGIDYAALPDWWRRWINVKRVFTQVLPRSRAAGMLTMMQAMGVPMEGRHHRGIDDCHNTARLAMALHQKGGRFAITGQRRPEDPLPGSLGSADADPPSRAPGSEPGAREDGHLAGEGGAVGAADGEVG